jgi:hypothetical protein
VKVATNVKAGYVWVINDGPKYVHTYRLTGAAAPHDTNDREEAVQLDIGAQIGSSVGIDVYVMALGSVGKVRVDLP